ncbi:MAG TPA: LppX_LprAFG lipoprotein [Dermatophilaceae bacterium]|nr:LppX_LprAFG lipoprotein [Dermatophilaceae bacterium]
MRRAAGLSLLCLVGLVGLVGCSGEEPTPTPTATTASAADRLAAARTKADAASSLHLVIRSRDVPSDASGVLAADGVGTRAPAFKGTFDARLRGAQLKVNMVSIGGTLYVKVPFTSIYAPTDPARYGFPDPAKLFAKNGGVTELLSATRDPKLGDRTRAGSEVVRTITGTLPGGLVVDLLGTGTRDGTFDVRYGITEPGDQLRTVDVTGPFFGASPSTYTVTLDRYGEKVEITKP